MIQSHHGFSLDGHFFFYQSLKRLIPLEIERLIIKAVGVDRYVFFSQNTDLSILIKQKSSINAPIVNIGFNRHQGS